MAHGLHPDLVLVNGGILTMDPARPKAQALAVRDGRFVALGTNEQMRNLAGPETRLLDAAGRTVLPGLIDAHLHFLSSGVMHVQAVDCSLPTLAEIQAALRARAQAAPEGTFIRGFQFDDTKMAECRHLTRQDLDAVSTRHGVYVSHRAGHTYYVNSLALKLAGVTRDTEDPAGGRYERDPRTGELTGVLQEAGRLVFEKFLPKATPADRREGLRLMVRRFHRAGLTSVHDASVTAEEFRSYQEAAAEGELTVRTYALIHHPHLDALLGAGLRTGFGNEWLRVGGVKFFTDGAIASRTAWLTEPYVGTQDRGILGFTAEDLYENMRRAHAAGFQLCTHANGDAAIEMVLDLYEKVLAELPRRDARPRIEHCTVVNPRILERLHKLSAVVTPFCSYVYFHGEKMKHYGAERLERMFAQRSFIDRGIVSTGSTDYPPGPYEPLMALQSCVTRTDWTGQVWGPSQRIALDEALRLYTRNGAYASFEENLKGSIAPDKLADLVVLGADPFKTDPNALKDIPIELTMVGGQVVFDAHAKC